MFSKPTIKLLLIVASFSLASAIVDYCNTQDLCSLTGFQHITCGSTGNLSPSCPPDTQTITLSQHNIHHIVDLHNQFRNQIASGNLPGFNPAAKMSSLQWNQDLADYAELNTRRCQYGHDCHNTPEMKYSGQNINSDTAIGGGAQFVDIPKFIKESINTWWNENQYASQNDIDNCCGSAKIPHFLEMSSQKANQIGCAIIQFTNNVGKYSYMVCNYSFTIVTGHKVYETGSPASGCETGSHEKYSALCSENESVAINDPFEP